ncbi:hypothetical protein ACHAXR_005662, partial [Thalassiosira sp. AJA248-18]
MTGKFTQNVHNLGYITGQTLHRLLLSVTNDDDNGDRQTYLSGLLYNYKNFTTTTTTTINPPRSITTIINNILSSSIPSKNPLSSLLELLITYPNRYRIWWINLLQTDPLHVLVETLLIVMCIALVVLQRRADWRFGQERKKGAPTEEEVEELLLEWKRETRKPLGGGGGGQEGMNGTKKTNGGLVVGTGLIVEKIEGSRLFLRNDSSSEPATTATSIPKSALNFATLDYLSTSSSRTLRNIAKSALSHYGCGSCGPRGFYGTIDAHLEVEDAMSNFLGTEGAILYSDGASASTSTMAAFAKRGDLLIVDEGVNEALLVGVTLSRANVRYFRHNDVRDLRRVLEKVRAQDVAVKRKPTDQRRYLVVEGLYRNWGTLSPLKEIVALKEEFHYRLIVDDSHGIGTLGKNGRGSLEHHGLKPMVHAEILTFSLENALGSVGGMTVGSEEVVDHQRLSGAGYCFSASAPPFLSKVCLASVRRLEGRFGEMMVAAEELEEGGDGPDDSEGNACSEEEEEEGEELNVNDMKVADLKIELKKRGLGVSGRKAELQQRLNDCLLSSKYNTPTTQSTEEEEEELSGPPLLERLHQNISNLYNTL